MLTTTLEPGATDPGRIRNFCIIAHIDHGKSTLADRMLQITGVVDPRQMRAQYLDRMDIERERGITIKSQAVRLPWRVREGDQAGEDAVLNMIDTPGHVDFTYEVSRSLAACEGAVLLVDAAQGIEAQTLANLYLAMENDLTVIPVLNKIDLPAAQPEKYAEELAHLIGCQPEDCLRVSGKTGEGVAHLLDEIVRQLPRRPVGDAVRAGPGDDLRLGVRRLPGRDHLRPGDRRPDRGPRPDQDDVHRRRARAAGARRDLAGADEGRRDRRRRGRLPDDRREGRPAVPGRRHGHHQLPARPRRRSAATRTRSRWSTRACIRSTARTTRICATRWTS